jgi:predicted RNA-binding Zn-ribbon protein involved in translation (DUF1610 family)
MPDMRFINLESVDCPKCGQRMPTLRVPESLHELMWGGWTCPNCGCEMDKWGKPRNAEDEG